MEMEIKTFGVIKPDYLFVELMEDYNRLPLFIYTPTSVLMTWRLIRVIINVNTV